MITGRWSSARVGLDRRQRGVAVHAPASSGRAGRRRSRRRSRSSSSARRPFSAACTSWPELGQRGDQQPPVDAAVVHHEYPPAARRRGSAATAGGTTGLGGSQARSGSWRSTACSQRPQPRSRLQPQLVAQHPPARAVRRQRVGLAPAAVEREHQLGPRPFPQRVQRPPAAPARPPLPCAGRARARRPPGPRRSTAAAPPTGPPRPARTARPGRRRAPGRATAPRRGRAPRRPARDPRRRARRGPPRRAGRTRRASIAPGSARST